MLELALARVPHATFVQAEVPPLPFADGAFDLAFSSNLYSHIESQQTRVDFLADALRVAPTVVILEQVWRPGIARESYERRSLLDGSDYQVFKRYVTPEELAGELHGSVVLDSPGFVAVRTSASS
jgi:hypothetical protein